MKLEKKKPILFVGWLSFGSMGGDSFPLIRWWGVAILKMISFKICCDLSIYYKTFNKKRKEKMWSSETLFKHVISKNILKIIF